MARITNNYINRILWTQNDCPGALHNFIRGRKIDENKQLLFLCGIEGKF